MGVINVGMGVPAVMMAVIIRLTANSATDTIATAPVEGPR